MSLTDPAASPPMSDDQSNADARKLKMYLVQFSRPEGHKSTAEAIELFNNIQETTLVGLSQANGI